MYPLIVKETEQIFKPTFLLVLLYVMHKCPSKQLENHYGSMNIEPDYESTA